ncbi:MAG: hypothetical protein SCALA702_09570 [Melioribacteraceae bacterium]|nr:MAG: hypothetical protein SCALA702_09570 [Melioribacteraceae bacterium]
MRFVFLLIFLIAGFLSAQHVPEEYYDAMEDFHRENYMAAYEKFSRIENEMDIDESFVATARFYAGESLYKLEELDGAAGKLEEFIDRFPNSNFHDFALYRLGQIYFEKKLYLNSRTKLYSLIAEHPESEYIWSAKYWIGESFLREEKYYEAEEHLLEAVSGRRNNRVIDYTIYSLGILYENIGDYTSAVTYYDELLAYYRESPLIPEAQFRIGISYFKLKEYDNAVLELSDPLIISLPQKKQAEAQFILANSFFRLKDYENASKIYSEILTNYPQNEENNDIWFGLAWVNFQLGEYDKAYEIFDKLSNSKDPEIAAKAFFRAGEAKRYSGDTEFALGIYEEFLQKYPDSELVPTVRFKIGVIYYNKGEISVAERYLITSLKDGDGAGKSSAFSLLGEISLNNEDFRSAENYFKNALENKEIPDAERFRAKLGLGVTLYSIGDYDGTIKNLNEIRIKNNRFEKEKINFYLAEAYFEKKDYSNSVKHFSRVNVDDAQLGSLALYGRAYSLFNLKSYADAVYYFTEFISRNPKDQRVLDARLRLADSYYGTKNFNRAAEIYNTAFRDNGNLFEDDYSYFQYGQTLFKSGNNNSAINILKSLQNRFPRSRYIDDSQYLIGWIHFQSGEYQNAITEYKKIIADFPGTPLLPVTFYSIGDGYYNISEYDSANVYYEKILEQFPATEYVFDAINGLQYSCIASDNVEKAIAVIDRFISDFPANELGDKILFKKGETYFNVGQYDKAITGYRELIATYPESELVPDAYYRIAKSAQNMGKEENAIYNYKLVIDNYIYTESGISAITELGAIFSEREEYDYVIELYNRIVNEVPDSKRLPEIIFLRGVAEKNNNMLPEAYESFNYINTYYAENLFSDKAKIELGIMELERKSFENAEMLFGEVGTGRTDDLGAKAQYYYGLTLYEQGKITDAITALVRVRSVFPIYDEWYSKSLIKLGDCYVKLKDKKQARDMYRAVAIKHNNDELGKEAKQKLNRL